MYGQDFTPFSCEGRELKLVFYVYPDQLTFYYRYYKHFWQCITGAIIKSPNNYIFLDMTMLKIYHSIFNYKQKWMKENYYT
jgi:hypothetical protein